MSALDLPYLKDDPSSSITSPTQPKKVLGGKEKRLAFQRKSLCSRDTASSDGAGSRLLEVEEPTSNQASAIAEEKVFTLSLQGKEEIARSNSRLSESFR